jgi:hypothetical protein
MSRYLHYPSVFVLGVFSLATVAMAQEGASTAKPANLYERVSAALAKRSDLNDLGKPPAEMRQVNWMLGNWLVEARVATDPEKKVDRGTSEVSAVLGGVWLQSTDRYPSGTQDLGMLTYNRVTRQWVNTSIDSNGNAITAYAPNWDGDRIVFLAEKTKVMGETATLRQVLTRHGRDEFEIVNSERTGEATWTVLDRYLYRRAVAKTAQ